MVRDKQHDQKRKSVRAKTRETLKMDGSTVHRRGILMMKNHPRFLYNA